MKWHCIVLRERGLHECVWNEAFNEYLKSVEIMFVYHFIACIMGALHVSQSYFMLHHTKHTKTCATLKTNKNCTNLYLGCSFSTSQSVGFDRACPSTQCKLFATWSWKKIRLHWSTMYIDHKEWRVDLSQLL